MSHVFKYQVIEAELKSSSEWVLTDEGKSVANEGSHEALVFNAVPADGSTTQAEIMVLLIIMMSINHLFLY